MPGRTDFTSDQMKIMPILFLVARVSFQGQLYSDGKVVI